MYVEKMMRVWVKIYLEKEFGVTTKGKGFFGESLLPIRVKMYLSLVEKSCKKSLDNEIV
ncbi:hypothetical protein GIY11_11690 [Aerococcaceae bacterium DSM 109653]|uniref:Uncharacterized protein n=1 Tax=Fundicoccus ignavus TaxID=2664442 RepID=A0A844BXP3_9LACT|nr:hypothetical protein [Fundicoccus ignavus]MRI82673.1 hypothetical protein [Fundicoccus ignavus]